ncbi:MAG: TetR/AcrR family transcriptional regulator [Rikenellaceae bacterium]
MEKFDTDKYGETEKRILEAAREVFLEKGMDHTKMQDIANAANISRTALNYYFRTKENLYKGILEQIFYTIIPSVESIISRRIPILEKIYAIIDVYDNMLRENRSFPRFVFTELQRDPKLVITCFKENEGAQRYVEKLITLINNEMENGNIRKIALEQVASTFFSVLVSPYLLNPAICEFLGTGNPVSNQMLDEHKGVAKEIMKSLLKPINE